MKKEDVVQIIQLAKTILQKEPNVLDIQDPVTVVGDIHGQYFDFLKLLQVGGKPETTKYLFLGDYVDRGQFSVEVIILILALKIYYKETIFMIRGNHEC